MSEIIKSFGIYAGYILTILSLIIFLVKPFRAFVIDMIKRHSEEDEYKKMLKEVHGMVIEMKDTIELQTESNLCLLRGNITEKYYRYLDSKKIPDYERINLIKQKDIYTKLHGNTYIDQIYEEMLQWEVIK